MVKDPLPLRQLIIELPARWQGCINHHSLFTHAALVTYLLHGLQVNLNDVKPWLFSG